jgi:two-component system LytT family response regulator
MQLKAIIVDDEELSRELLHSSLNEYCPEVEVGGEAESVEDAHLLIEKYQPDIVFLDIQMPKMNGFDLIGNTGAKKFETVFVTAYQQFAINAIKAGAADYLLKPIDVNELKTAVGKLYAKHVKNKKRDYYLFPDDLDKTITIKHIGGFRILQMREIVRLEANDNYTNIFLTGGHKLTVSKTLKEFEQKFQGHWFLRVHKSYIINLFHLKEYLTEDGGQALLSDNKKIPVSRFSMSEIIEYVKRFTGDC